MEAVNNVVVSSLDFSEGCNIQTAALDGLFVCPVVGKECRGRVIRHIDSKYYPQEEELELHQVLNHKEVFARYCSAGYEKGQIAGKVRAATARVFTEGSPWSLYKVYYGAMTKLMGVVLLEKGFAFEQNVSGEVCYKNLYVVNSQDDVGVRIKEFFVCDEMSREEAYYKLVIMAMGMAVNFSAMGGS